MSNFEKEAELNRLNNLIEKYETSLFPLLRFVTIVGFGFTLGIIGAAEVLWVLWVLVQLAKGLM